MTETIYLDGSAERGFFDGASCAFGVFDGVHLGHRYLIGQARRSAEEEGAASGVITFSVDPDELFARERLLKLMDNGQRLAALASTGVDFVAVLPFDREFAALSPQRFLDWAFGCTPPAHVHVGEGFRFGCRAQGTAQDMRDWGRGRLQVHEHKLLSVGEQPVSSTRIRGLVTEGRCAEARRLLGPSAPLLQPIQ